MGAVVLPFPRGGGKTAASTKAKVRVAFAEFAVRRWAAHVGLAPDDADHLARLWARAAADPANDGAIAAAMAYGRALRCDRREGVGA